MCKKVEEEEFSIKITKVLDSLAERGFKRLLRDEQKSSLRQLLHRGDLLAMLPTGFGKSLIFQALPGTKNAHLECDFPPFWCGPPRKRLR